MIKKRTLMLVGFLIASIVFIECDTKSTQKEAITPTEQVTEKTDYKEIYNHLIAEYKPEIISEETFIELLELQNQGDDQMSTDIMDTGWEDDDLDEDDLMLM